ncbi:MAG: LacI family DNA-binding transcriptional regulator [Spirochaetales bacterium]|nr:LacI family DNA-binding transcriptional regulator [Spirochaetales bacterium]
MNRVHHRRNTTIRDIADSLGISRGTVDRAIHNRKGVSAGTRERVMKKARELGYSPNRLAQFLVTGKTVDIAFITPKDPLWQDVKEGAHSFLAGLADHIIKIQWYETNVHDPQREAAILQQVLDSGVQGIGLAPADTTMLTELIDRAVENNTAIVTLNTDAADSRRLCFVGQDSKSAGRLAGELMGKFLMGRGRILVIVAFQNVMAHRNRLDSFRAVLRERFPEVVIEEILENHDSEEEAYRLVKTFLERKKTLDGVYLTTGNGPAGTVRALQEAGLEGKVRVVCFDFFREIVDLLKRGWVHAAIGQDPYRQGYQTMKVLYDYIIEGREPPADIIYTKMDVGLQENIDVLVRMDRTEPVI